MGVVLATNGYTGDLWPRLRQTIIAANSFQVATKPLSDNVRSLILPGGQSTSDLRRIGLCYRLDHTGRFLLGGRGTMREPMQAQDWSHIETMMERMFPQLKGAGIDFRWGGRVALTRDHLPHLHEPAPGLLIDIGCMGRGVALQSALGRAMAAYIASGDPAGIAAAPRQSEPAAPFHGLNKLYFQMRSSPGTASSTGATPARSEVQLRNARRRLLFSLSCAPLFLFILSPPARGRGGVRGRAQPRRPPSPSPPP